MQTYKKGISDALHHDIHIWIGSESSQDEYGTAAYKMVEADDYMGGTSSSGAGILSFRKLIL